MAGAPSGNAASSAWADPDVMPLLVALAGGAGAVARHLVDLAVARHRPAWAATLGINLAGSLLMGLVSTADAAGVAVALVVLTASALVARAAVHIPLQDR